MPFLKIMDGVLVQAFRPQPDLRIPEGVRLVENGVDCSEPVGLATECPQARVKKGTVSFQWVKNATASGGSTLGSRPRLLICAEQMGRGKQRAGLRPSLGQWASCPGVLVSSVEVNLTLAIRGPQMGTEHSQAGKALC